MSGRTGGRFIIEAPANPAAGADFSAAVPAGEFWQFLGATVQFQASAAAANRQIVLNLDIGGLGIYRVEVPFNVTANQSPYFQVGSHGQLSAAMSPSGSLVLIPCPRLLFMTAGAVFRSSTTGLQAADQWNIIRIHVLKWN